MLPSSSAQCLYASDAGTDDIAAFNIQTRRKLGTSPARPMTLEPPTA